ncbi:MAG TPA: LysM peptidoglycan-binding domain-containing protein [Burkholderiales bacterium]
MGRRRPFPDEAVMKKSITAVLASFLCAAALVYAQGDIQLKENAPDSYVVQKGDTLWSIAVKFLKDPWRWPEIWRLNQEQIRNPHEIVPGSTIVLDRTGAGPGGDGQPQLRLGDAQPQQRLQLGQGGSTERLGPKIYSEPISAEAIPAIPANVIEPFLTQPLVIENGGLAKAPRIIATQESRVYLGRGGIAYVTGFGKSQEEIWQIYRQGRPLVDPDDNRTLGYEAVYLGTARVTRGGDPATVQIVSSKQEITAGDRLVAAGKPAPIKYAPHAPTKQLKGRVIGLYDGLATAEGGRHSIISINKGARDGLEHGHVLALYRRGALIADPESGLSRDNAPKFQLPDERYGLAFVFRVFDNVSYALVMESSRQLTPGDVVQTP